MTAGPVWVKVCGLRRAEDVLAAVRAGVDAVGLILTPRSPRAVSPEQAAELARLARAEASASGRRVLVVGVFGGEPEDVIVDGARRSGVDAVQLHGGEAEPVRLRLETAGFRTIRVLWPSEMPPTGKAATPTPAPDGPPAARPWAVLLDSHTPSGTGGTGVRLDVGLAAAWTAHLAAQGLRVILAGGLRPDNVTDALRSVRPWGVDVSSGVERPGQPGVKDPEAIRAFVEAVRAWEGAFHESPA